MGLLVRIRQRRGDKKKNAGKSNILLARNKGKIRENKAVASRGKA